VRRRPGARRLAEVARARGSRRAHLRHGRRRRPAPDRADRQRDDQPLGARARRAGCPPSTRRPGAPPRAQLRRGAAHGLGLGLPADLLVAGLGGLHRRPPRMELKGVVAACASTTTTPTTRPSWSRSWPPRARSPGGRVVVAFQPHRYSRTLAFAEAFGQALGAPTRSSSWRSTRGGGPGPRRHRRDRGLRGAAARGAGRLRAVLVRRPAGARGPGPPRRPRAHPGAGDVTQIGPEVLRLLAAPGGHA
jgi:UDP-N-acetylmuramate--alanine ligase